MKTKCRFIWSSSNIKYMYTIYGIQSQIFNSIFCVIEIDNEFYIWFISSKMEAQDHKSRFHDQHQSMINGKDNINAHQIHRRNISFATIRCVHSILVINVPASDQHQYTNNVNNNEN